MGSVYDLKPRFQALLRPCACRLAKCGITANQLTLAAVALSLATSATLIASAPATWAFSLLAPVLLLRMALNAGDGILAREFGQATALGHHLNEIGDVICDVALIAPFAFVPVFEPGWVAAVAFLSVLTEFAGVLALGVGGARRYDGPMGKSDRAVVLALLGLWLASGMAQAALVPVMPLLCILLAWTVVNRTLRALRVHTNPRTGG